MTDNAQASASADESQQDERPRPYREAVDTCDDLVDQYRSKQISKLSAIRQIDSTLTDAFGSTNPKLHESCTAYIDILDNHDFHESEAYKRARPSSRSPSVDNQENLTEPPRQRLKLDREASETSKTLDVDESETPWGLTEAVNSLNLPPSLQKTNELIKRYSSNPKGYKRSLLNSTNCPEFPDGEWQNVLAGRPVNLDTVFGNYYSTSNNDRRIESIGDIEIRYGTAPSKRSISSVGDWTIAWGIATTAITYAFPNRFDELTSYGRYILGLFASTNFLFHERIISLDKAIRRRVGSTRKLQLTDYQSFADLKDSHLESTGAAIGVDVSQPHANQSKIPKPNPRTSRKNEACNKWNDGTCTLSASACRRSHVCNVCKKSDHRGKDCKQHDK